MATPSTPVDQTNVPLFTDANPGVVTGGGSGGTSDQVQGAGAAGAAAVGNPVGVGGVHTTALPTLTNGQRGNLQLDANGRLLTAASLATTGTRADVAANASSVTILASNAARKRAIIKNDSPSATLYLNLVGATASATAYSVDLAPGAIWIETDYMGLITGIWSAAVGAARVTENT